MTNYCTPIPILHVATLPEFLLFFEFSMLKVSLSVLGRTMESRRSIYV